MPSTSHWNSPLLLREDFVLLTPHPRPLSLKGRGETQNHEGPLVRVFALNHRVSVRSKLAPCWQRISRVVSSSPEDSTRTLSFACGRGQTQVNPFVSCKRHF